MIRRLITFLSGLSTLLALATAVLWVRSYYHQDQFFSIWLSRRLHGLCYVYSDAGAAQMEIDSGGDSLGPMRTLSEWSYLGVSFSTAQEGSIHIREIGCKYATVLIALAALPLTRSLVRVIRRPRSDHPTCRSCGYDLRASKDRCPECGTPIPPQATATS
jgi:hypothetical protein